MPFRCSKSENGQRKKVFDGREFYFESGKSDNLKKSQGIKKNYNTAELTPLKSVGSLFISLLLISQLITVLFCDDIFFNLNLV